MVRSGITKVAITWTENSINLAHLGIVFSVSYLK